jgi:RNA polymerase sigma-70 factor (ECF subfamily)
LAQYSGRGALRSWLRVVATRLILDLGKRQQAIPIGDAILHGLPDPTSDPELRHLRDHYGSEFARAFGDAAAALDSRERNLLRYSYLDGIGIDQIGAFFGVHRATAARWVNQARDRLVVGVRAALCAQLQVGSAELDSIFRLISSQLDISLRRHLEDTPD